MSAARFLPKTMATAHEVEAHLRGTGLHREGNTVIDLAMQGIPLKQILVAFAEVRQFRALGEQSFPMCRTLTSALIGHAYEFNTMGFEELLVHYAPERSKR
jgi:hypothetical protein